MDRKRFVLFVLAILFVVAAKPATPATSVQAAVMAPVHQFIDGVNTGNMKMAVTACASPAYIIDDFPPHTWWGNTACADWGSAFNASVKQAGITDGHVTLATPWHVDVTGDRAYVVVPATYTYKDHGKPMTESGSIYTLVLQKQSSGWRIAAWTWAQH